MGSLRPRRKDARTMSGQQPPDSPDSGEGIAELETLVGETPQTGAMVHGAIDLKPPEETPLSFDDRYRFERALGRGGGRRG